MDCLFKIKEEEEEEEKKIVPRKPIPCFLSRPSSIFFLFQTKMKSLLPPTTTTTTNMWGTKCGMFCTLLLMVMVIVGTTWPILLEGEDGYTEASKGFVVYLLFFSPIVFFFVLKIKKNGIDFSLEREKKNKKKLLEHFFSFWWCVYFICTKKKEGDDNVFMEAYIPEIQQLRIRAGFKKNINQLLRSSTPRTKKCFFFFECTGAPTNLKQTFASFVIWEGWFSSHEVTVHNNIFYLSWFKGTEMMDVVFSFYFGYQPDGQRGVKNTKRCFFFIISFFFFVMDSQNSPQTPPKWDLKKKQISWSADPRYIQSWHKSISVKNQNKKKRQLPTVSVGKSDNKRKRE